MVGLAKLLNSQLISSYFQYMLCIFSSHPFYPKYVCLPTADNPVLPTIHENLKFWPYFKDALGTLDGCHIRSSPPLNEHAASRNCKGFLSQNCLFGCSFEF
jgi:hypothetical protein